MKGKMNIKGSDTMNAMNDSEVRAKIMGDLSRCKHLRSVKMAGRK
jgi:hypothetical protein